MRRFQVLAALAVLALVAFLVDVYVEGCRNPKPREATLDPSGANLLFEGGAISLTSDGGTISLGGPIPDDFPKAVPVYPGAKVNLARRAPGDKQSWALALATGDDPEHVVTFYRTHLAGFETTSDRTLAETHMSTWRSPQLDLTLVIAQGGDQETSISMTVTSR
jgi:hypothetical protein